MNDLVTLYHNPDCGTSRNTLALIRACGIEPSIIEYLKTPPDRQTLQELLARMKMSVRDVIRIRGTPYRELGLEQAHWSDDALIGQMLAHPILINRPIVISPKGVRLCRPSELALELLPQLPDIDLHKEDGTPFLRDQPVGGDDTGLTEALREAGLPTSDLAEAGRHFFRYTTMSGERVGYGGFERLGQDVLLRSLVVLPGARHRGIGRAMLALLLRRAFDEGGRDAWLLTTTATPFFMREGFRPIERAQAPASVLGTRQARNLCPGSAVLLGRTIGL